MMGGSRWWWMVMDGDGSWWMVVDIFWLVVGGSGWWWVVVGRGKVYSNPLFDPSKRKLLSRVWIFGYAFIFLR